MCPRHIWIQFFLTLPQFDSIQLQFDLIESDWPPVAGCACLNLNQKAAAMPLEST
jgi:hypothetical protein